MKHSLLSVALLCAMSSSAMAEENLGLDVFDKCFGDSVPALVECGNKTLDAVNVTIRKYFTLLSAAEKSEYIQEKMERADKTWYEYVEADCGYRGETEVVQCKYQRYALRMSILKIEYEASRSNEPRGEVEKRESERRQFDPRGK
jgi:hypothetical protein